MSSTPSLTEFDPRAIRWQYDVVRAIRKEFKYDDGPHEILLSGSVGSAKSILMAHVGLTHVLKYPGARLLLGRKTMPDLKDTILAKLLDHMYGDLIEGVHYEYNMTRGSIDLWNGSQVISRSWADKKFKKFRSLDLSAALIEELTENDGDFWQFYPELVARIGRLTDIPECFLMAATNPDSPSHPAHGYFIKGSEGNPNRHVYYSRTEDNIFLPTWYIPSLRKKYDKKMIMRLLEGKWISLNTDVIYYEYDSKKHFILKDTKPSPRWPVRFTFDFNIGVGKPMSSTVFQFNRIREKFTFIDEVVVEGTRTLDSMEEWQGKGYFDLPGNPQIIVHGDQTGSRRDTRSIHSDYDIIDIFMSNYVRKDKQRLNFEISVPSSNPSIRDRHNIVNGQLCNADGVVNIEIDKRCKTLDEGFEKTKLKPGAEYIEDDSKKYQHITTAAGYAIYDIIEYPETDDEITLS